MLWFGINTPAETAVSGYSESIGWRYGRLASSESIGWHLPRYARLTSEESIQQPAFGADRPLLGTTVLAPQALKKHSPHNIYIYIYPHHYLLFP
jgi:hypothetical protein